MIIEGTTVVMDEWEMFDAGIKEVRRHVQNRALGRGAAYGLKGLGWNEGMMGAFGEAAVAMFFNAHWSGAIGNLGAADVGRVQVRTIADAALSLILHDKRDKDEDCFVLVHYDIPKFRLLGWVYGREGKQPRYWRTDTGRPAFFVPQQALRTDFDVIRSVIHADVVPTG